MTDSSSIIQQTQRITDSARNEQRDHEQHTPSEPEGAAACLQVLGAFLVYTATWGFLSTYGSYEKYYETTLLVSVPAAKIAWVGTIQGTVLIFGGVITGPIFDRGYVRELLVGGSAITVFGIMMLSLAKEYYQILLAQGFCVGIGSAMLYVPSITLVALRFQRHRAMAVFAATTGTAVGGIIYPIIFSVMVQKPALGFAWATRVLGFITLAELLVALAIILPTLCKKPLQNPRPVIDPAAFRDGPFMVFCLALFLMWMAYWVPFFLLPTFAQFKGGASSNFAFYILVICNASTIPGRFIAVPLCGKIGPARAMAAFALCSGILFFGWIGVKSVAYTIVWAVFIALFMAPMAVVYPIIVPLLCPNKDVVGSRMGISSAAAALGTLAGFPITSALNDVENGVFWRCQVLNGSCMLCGAVLMMFVFRKMRKDS